MSQPLTQRPGGRVGGWVDGWVGNTPTPPQPKLQHGAFGVAPARHLNIRTHRRQGGPITRQRALCKELSRLPILHPHEAVVLPHHHPDLDLLRGLGIEMACTQRVLSALACMNACGCLQLLSASLLPPRPLSTCSPEATHSRSTSQLCVHSGGLGAAERIRRPLWTGKS